MPSGETWIHCCETSGLWSASKKWSTGFEPSRSIIPFPLCAVKTPRHTTVHMEVNVGFQSYTLSQTHRVNSGGRWLSYTRLRQAVAFLMHAQSACSSWWPYMHSDRFPLRTGSLSPVKMSNYRAEPSSPCHVLVAPTPEWSLDHSIMVTGVTQAAYHRLWHHLQCPESSFLKKHPSKKKTKTLAKKVRKRVGNGDGPESPGSLTRHFCKEPSWGRLDVFAG